MLRWGGAPRSFVHPWTVTRRRRSSVSVSADTKTTHLKFRRIKTSKLLSTFDCIGPYKLHEMAKPSDRIVHLTKSIAEVIQMRGVSILSRGYALVAVNIDLETVLYDMRRSPPTLP